MSTPFSVSRSFLTTEEDILFLSVSSYEPCSELFLLQETGFSAKRLKSLLFSLEEMGLLSKSSSLFTTSCDSVSSILFPEEGSASCPSCHVCGFEDSLLDVCPFHGVKLASSSHSKREESKSLKDELESVWIDDEVRAWKREKRSDGRKS
jgi:uncharacterized Zn finger protein (UPF0148 family)